MRSIPVARRAVVFGCWLGLIALVAAARLGAVEAAPPSYALTVWATENGVPGDILAIAQDLEGYLWLGTPTGLIRFDGLSFKRWMPADAAASLPGGPVHALVGAADGSLWVGLGGGGSVVRIHDGHVTRYSPSDGAPPGVTSMIQDRQGAIWVAARRGLFRFANGRWTTIGAADGYSGVEAFSVYEDRAGRLWAGTADGVYRWANDGFELVDTRTTNVQSFAEDASGDIWVTDRDTIVQRLSTNTSPKLAPDIRLPAGAWRLLTDSRDQLWIAAFGGGLLRVRDAVAPDALIERVEYEHRLAGSPRSVYEDRENNIWVGMRGGLLRLSESSFASASPLEGLNYDGVRTTAVGKDGSVWVATSHGLNRFSGARHEAYGVSQTLALHADNHGALWVSTSQELGRLVNGGVAPVPIPEVALSSRVMAMTTDSSDTLWLCSSLRGVMSWNGTHLSRFEEHPSVSNRACHSIHTDRRDRVWIGFTSGGAAVHDKGTFQVFGPEEGVPSGTVLGIVEDRSGAVWLSTSTGVARYQNGRLVAITRDNAPLIDLVPVLIEDEDGYLWVGVHSGAGVIRFHPSEFDNVAVNPSHRLEYTLYDESDGMQRGSQTWQAGVGGVRGGDGRLWVATGLGMAVIDPRNLPPAQRPPPPRIESITVDGRPLASRLDLSLPANNSTLEIGFGTASLSSASKLRFRYMLEGIDQEWVYAGNVREATYTSLPPGSYRFRVSAAQDSRWTEATSWSFAVAPPFYLTRAFMAMIITSIVLMLVTGWWLRLRAMREQYALVFAERARVSREIHDTLLQSLAALGVELEALATQLDPQSSVRDGLRRLRRQVGHSVREARESILELRHDSTKPRALVQSLQELADATTNTKGVRTELSVEGRPRQCAADADFQLSRIVQEAVNNAVKHGRANRVRISLVYDQHRIVVTVADDGIGFKPDEHADASSYGEHLGLLTMRERAARIGGRLSITSAPGGGTTVEATVPLVAR
jgi:signal transduction histidine kinase/ligand-binding sensor domain-containing protein